MTGTETPNAFAVSFRDLELWAVGTYFTVSWGWSEENVHPLSTALKRKQKKLDRIDPPADLALASLHFDGSIEAREDDPLSSRGSLYLAVENDVFYSKIDVRHGAIAVVPSGYPPLAVSSEYPVYSIDRSVALPLYIQLLFRTEYFRAALNSKVSGASGRKRVNPEGLSQIEVPLPPLPIQEAIIRPWAVANESLLRARGDLRLVSVQLDQMLRERCDPYALEILKTHAFGLRFAQLEGWDVPDPKATVWERSHSAIMPLSHYAEEATDLVSPENKPELEWPVYGVNNRTGVFFSHYQLGAKFNSAYKRISKDWFFHNPTRSAVGSLGIVPAVPPDAITSPEYQVWKIKGGLKPAYVATLLGTELLRELIQIYRSGGVKQRLYVNDLLRIRLPVPSLSEQEEIVASQNAALANVAAAESELARAQREVEHFITEGSPGPE
jgi:hypothetical protein